MSAGLPQAPHLLTTWMVIALNDRVRRNDVGDEVFQPEMELVTLNVPVPVVVLGGVPPFAGQNVGAARKFNTAFEPPSSL